MKKVIKYTALLSGCILTQHLMNRAYFMLMGKRADMPAKPRFKDHFYKWRFGRIHYKVTGKGEPLIFIHGIYPGADMSQWRGIDPELLKSYRVYAIDLLGFGRSEKPNTSYSAYLYVRLICDFIQDIIKKPAVAAASDYSAAYIAMSYIFRPDLYRKLLLIKPSGFAMGHKMPSLRDCVYKMLLETPVLGTSIYLFLTNKTIGRHLLEKLWSKRSIASNIPSAISYSAYIGGANARFPISALFSQYLNVGIKDKLDKILVPMLILPNDDALRNLALSSNITDFLNL